MLLYDALCKVYWEENTEEFVHGVTALGENKFLSGFCTIREQNYPQFKDHNWIYL